jgi:hypothetical protein
LLPTGDRHQKPGHARFWRQIPGEADSPSLPSTAGSGIIFSLFRDERANDTGPGDMVIGGLSIVYQAAIDGVFSDRFQMWP